MVIPHVGRHHKGQRLRDHVKRPFLLTVVLALSSIWALISVIRAVRLWSRGQQQPTQQFSGLRGDSFEPGKVWLDTDGDFIQAHGGGVLLHEGLYYWYGENRGGKTYTPWVPGYSTARVDVIGVSVYVSRDLLHWQYGGLALKGGSHPDLAPHMVLERPKVMYHGGTGKFALWLHIDNANYTKATAGVAVADSPLGPFTYLGSLQPSGQMARDITVFKDTDGTAYIIFSSEDNRVMHIHRLGPDYLSIEGTYNRVFIQQSREAPAMFKYKQWYLMATSGCTGWEPNALEVFWADHPLSTWHSLGNPCQGHSSIDAAYTFWSQPAFVLPIASHPGLYIFMADRWQPTNLAESRYVWLPMWVEDAEPQFQGGKLSSPVVVTILWEDAWQLQGLADDDAQSQSAIQNLRQ